MSANKHLTTINISLVLAKAQRRKAKDDHNSSLHAVLNNLSL